MLSGAILSVLFGSLGDTRPDMRTIKLVFAIQFIVGAVLGGVAWQFYKALRDWKPKS
jgi:hypothetical protein